jgi:serine O-acetyltransferase
METLEAYQKRDPAARSKLEVLLLYPGVHALIYHRIAHFLFVRRMRFLARAISQWSRFWTGIEIHPGAQIGRRFVIDHGSGIVIGETTEIGDDVLLYQGVTLGGTGKEKGKRHPTLGNNVMVGAGARVLGPFLVGDNARIASNAVVLREVPSDSTAVGVPAQIVRIAGERINFAAEVDQIHVDDPVQQELKKLMQRLERLENRRGHQADEMQTGAAEESSERQSGKDEQT